MEASPFLTGCRPFTTCSLPSPSVCLFTHNRNSIGVYSRSLERRRRTTIGTRSNVLRFCTEKGNLEATGIPTSVPVRVAYELLLAGHHYLDVRTPEEFSTGHVSGATNIPYMYIVGSGMTTNTKFVEEVSAHYGKYNELLIGCQSGKRSTMAAADLLKAGFTCVTDVAGGYSTWSQTRLPVEN